MLGTLFTGVDAGGGSVRILDSKDGIAAASYTSKDPGSFVCRGLFVHGDLRIGTTENVDAAAHLTADAIRQIMSNHPNFVEWFKVSPLGDRAYRLTLLPSSIQLSREYAREFWSPETN